MLGNTFLKTNVFMTVKGAYGLFGRDLRPCWDFSVFCNHHNPVPHKIKVIFNILITWERSDYNAFADAHILVKDRAFNIAIPANPNREVPARFLNVVIIRSQQNTIFDYSTFCNLTSNTHNRMCDFCFANAATFCEQDILQFAVFNNRAWQKTSMGIDR